MAKKVTRGRKATLASATTGQSQRDHSSSNPLTNPQTPTKYVKPVDDSSGFVESNPLTSIATPTKYVKPADDAPSFLESSPLTSVMTPTKYVKSLEGGSASAMEALRSRLSHAVAEQQIAHAARREHELAVGEMLRTFLDQTQQVMGNVSPEACAPLIAAMIRSLGADAYQQQLRLVRAAHNTAECKAQIEELQQYDSKS